MAGIVSTSGQTALVVGGAGATGRHLTAGLDKRGYKLTILHRGVHEPEHLAKYEHIHADPHFGESVSEAIGDRNFDLVILTYGRTEQLAKVFAGKCGRLIAVGGVPVHDGYVDPLTSYPTGTPIAAKETDIVDPSRIADPRKRKFVEKMLSAENTIFENHAASAYDATLFRYPLIYGPLGIISYEWSIVKRANDNRKFVLLPNSGMNVITRCSAQNAAHMLLLSLDTSKASGEIFNCADSQQFSVRQWAEIVSDTLDANLELIGLPPQLNWCASQFAMFGGSVFGHIHVDSSKARELLGYKDAIEPVDAISEIARWARDHGAPEGNSGWVSDSFDYELEDRVKARLDALQEEFPEPEKEPLAAHPYPHPKKTSLKKDEQGR